jgi:hypothetical protein
MPPKPLATCFLLAVTLLATTACSSGGDSPSPGDNSSSKTSTKGTGGPTTTKLQKLTGKGDIKNVIVKTESGGKISLSAKAPGHEIMEQTYDSKAKTWSAPTSVFKDDTRYCHAMKVKHRGSTIAATVICSISAKDTSGTQSSYVLATTDGKTWKRMDLAGARGKPILSPSGNVVAWSSPTSFLLWNAMAKNFKSVKYTQSADSPTVGVMQNNGVLVMLKATAGKKDTCTISFLSASASAPTPRPINSTLPQSGHPKCVATSAKLQGAEIIANFNSTSTTKDANGKKVRKTTTFALGFAKLPSGKWLIKTP